MGKDLITRSRSRAYEERKLTGMSIDKLLFNTVDNDLSANFRLDRYISSPYGLSYRNLVNQSLLRKFNPGTTELIEVPIASEKTDIDEELMEAVAVGNEPTDSQAVNLARNVDQIMGDYMEAEIMTRSKQAIEVVRTGIFPANGDDGEDLGLGYDHGRDAGNNIVYDFTAGGATMNEALLQLSQKADDVNMPKSNRVALAGKNWLSQYGSDSGIIEIMKANSANQILEQERFERQFGQVDGLFVIAVFRPVGATAPIWIMDYTPGTEYVAYKGATPEPFIPDNELILLSLNDRTYRINRGVNAIAEAGNRIQRVVNDGLVYDEFVENDPPTAWVRAQARHIFLYGNINHTVVSTGTFA